jgi:hypothetical protein
MTNSKIASFVAGLAMLAFGAASCDIFDPYDPGDPGNGGGGNGGGCDTIIVDTLPGDDWGRDTSGNHDDGDDQGTFVRSEGTIVWVQMEGGFWGIEAANGHEYEPVNLPQEFMENGLNVAFTGQVLQDWGSITQWGSVLEVHTMQRLR